MFLTNATAPALSLAVHDRGVHFLFAFVRKDRTASGVKKRKIFERADRRLDRVERTAAFSSIFQPAFKRIFKPAAIFGLKCGRHLRSQDRSRPAVNC